MKVRLIAFALMFAFCVRAAVLDTLHNMFTRKKLLVVKDNSLPKGQTSVVYTYKFSGQGGKWPYKWSIQGPMPTGFVLNDNVLSGVSGAPLNAPVNIAIRDAEQTLTGKIFVLTICAPSGSLYFQSNPPECK